MRRTVGLGLCLLLPATCLGCAGGGGSPEATPQEVKRATAYINPRSGAEVHGAAIFIKEGSQITLQVNIENAPPGEHACHIHEIGDCSAEDATSAGGHWNPGGQDHGRWGQAPFHLGDIGNIMVGEDGKGSIMLSTDSWSMGTGAENDIMGKAVIIHADPDDFASQPTGAAGGRIGCGVINAG